MIRDKIKDAKYFLEYIAQQNNRIENFQNKLDKNEVNSERIFSIRYKIDALKFEVLIARFSSGVSFKDLKLDYIERVKAMPEFWSSDNYNDMLRMLSLGILFDVEDEIILILKNLIDAANMKDYLLNFLLNFVDKNVEYLGYDFLHPTPYKFLKNVIESDEIVALNYLKEYLEKKWYSGNRDAGWYDIHLNNQKLYSGYWSYESGAIMKILEYDDVLLKDTQYYPFDMVHHKKL
jgi:hypothetical protein